MSDIKQIIDFPDSSCIIPFIFKDIGAERDIPQVYWDTTRWVQILYDAFRERWSGNQPILYAGYEAVITHFKLDSSAYTIDELASSSPDRLRSPGNSALHPGIIALDTVTSYVRWYDAATKREYLAEKFSSGLWCMARLDKEAFRWDIITSSLSDAEIWHRYSEHLAQVSFLGGIPPDARLE